MTQAEIALRVLSHTDNAEPINADWLESIWIFHSKRGDSGLNEFEAIVMVTQGGEQKHSYDWNEPPRGSEVTVIGINLDSMRPFIGTWGQDIISLPPIATRLEFRLLLVSLKAWGYTGK